MSFVFALISPAVSRRQTGPSSELLCCGKKGGRDAGGVEGQ